MRIGVLGLFHPPAQRPRTPSRELTVRVAPGGQGVLVRDADGERAQDRVEADGELELSVPGKLRRRYRGELTIAASAGELQAALTLELEQAVAAIVAAETAPDWPPAALEAQAIVTRSYLSAARERHQGFDFCDTTHCQWMAAGVGPEHAAFKAARRTEGLVLSTGAEVVEALFSRSCGGRTKTLADVGLKPGGYPFYAVECSVCRRRPDAWSRDLAAVDAAEARLHPGSEAARLTVTRRLGWDALPSNAYRLRERAGRLTIEGVGRGHGVGLCQAGARGLAADGVSAFRLLELYFPGAKLGRPPAR